MRESIEKSNGNHRYDDDKSKSFKKKGPKHGKMGPMKKDKYKNKWGE